MFYCPSVQNPSDLIRMEQSREFLGQGVRTEYVRLHELLSIAKQRPVPVLPDSLPAAPSSEPLVFAQLADHRSDAYECKTCAKALGKWFWQPVRTCACRPWFLFLCSVNF